MSNLVNFKIKKSDNKETVNHEGRVLIVDFYMKRVDKEWLKANEPVVKYYKVLNFNKPNMYPHEEMEIRILKSLEEQFKKVS